MPCFHPRHIHYHPTEKTVNGGKLLIWNAGSQAPALNPIVIPCQRCVGCRLERSRQWAVRVMHEASLHEANCFVTLTFNDEHLPPYGLDHSYFQKFFKRLKSLVRRSISTEAANKIRFYMCGEYGENFGRPHFHICLFGFGFPDKTPWKVIRGNQLYRSQILERAWTIGKGKNRKSLGYSSIGNLTFESAAYVARYIMKKRMGAVAEQHYEILDEYGEYHRIAPEYNKMSLKPGIGAGWYEKYHRDIYPSDFIIFKEKKMKPPKYYDKLHELVYPHDSEEIKFKRYTRGKLSAHHNTEERLAVREEIQLEKLKKLKREL